MNTPNHPQPTPADPDLAAQAVPGHGVPSQDPDPAAQVPLTTEESARESKSVLMGGGLVAGAAAGAAVGAAVAGPAGVMLGGMLGSIAGTLGGAAAGPSLDSDDKAPPAAAGGDTLP